MVSLCMCADLYAVLLMHRYHCVPIVYTQVLFGDTISVFVIASSFCLCSIFRSFALPGYAELLLKFYYQNFQLF